MSTCMVTWIEGADASHRHVVELLFLDTSLFYYLANSNPYYSTLERFTFEKWWWCWLILILLGYRRRRGCTANSMTRSEKHSRKTRCPHLRLNFCIGPAHAGYGASWSIQVIMNFSIPTSLTILGAFTYSRPVDYIYLLSWYQGLNFRYRGNKKCKKTLR